MCVSSTVIVYCMSPQHIHLITAWHLQVTAEDMIHSEEVFGGLGHLATSLLPEGRLMDFVRQQK